MKRLALLAFAAAAALRRKPPPVDSLRGQQLHVRTRRSGDELQHRERRRHDATTARPAGSELHRDRRHPPLEPHPWEAYRASSSNSPISRHRRRRIPVDAQCRLAARHFLNTANADWDLRGNIAKKKWTSWYCRSRAMPRCRRGACERELPAIRGIRRQDREIRPRRSPVAPRKRPTRAAMYVEIYGSVAKCVDAGGTTSSCGNTTTRRIPANPTPIRLPRCT